jgi:hypothetical protein
MVSEALGFGGVERGSPAWPASPRQLDGPPFSSTSGSEGRHKPPSGGGRRHGRSGIPEQQSFYISFNFAFLHASIFMNKGYFTKPGKARKDCKFKTMTTDIFEALYLENFNRTTYNC